MGAAAVLLVKISIDMSVFGSAQRVAAWVGIWTAALQSREGMGLFDPNASRFAAKAASHALTEPVAG